MKKATDIATGWAWEIYNEHSRRWELCYWMQSTRSDLVHESKPSPEARPVKVTMQRVRHA